MIRTCACGRVLKAAERIALTGVRPCPDCGASAYRWEKPVGLWRWLLAGLGIRARTKPQQPRYTPEHPGPRVLSCDYGFAPDATSAFLVEPIAARATLVTERLHLTARKNRWRFEQL